MCGWSRCMAWAAVVASGCVPQGFDTGRGPRGAEGPRDAQDADAGNGGANRTGASGTRTLPVQLPSCLQMNGTECQGGSCCEVLAVDTAEGGLLPLGRGREICKGCQCGCPPYSVPDGGCKSTEFADELPEHLVKLSAFALDKYEVTVGRFRAFLAAYDDWWGSGHPEPGEGANPHIPGSGWNPEWNDSLPRNQDALRSALLTTPKCLWRIADGSARVDNQAMNCVTWYEAFAFCVWDGERLPTAAEWEYAAAGGEENRLYPWSDPDAALLPALHNFSLDADVPSVPVGSFPAGNGRWGHADLAGNRGEWVLDWWHPGNVEEASCPDSSNPVAPTVDPGAFTVTPTERSRKGGSWASAPAYLRNAASIKRDPQARTEYDGFRCARSE
jgi:formylglycine-generating enzyme